ncbi:UNVERIFIED_CONTAM: hypothetical protein Slati_0294900 [Sesamum latifolium]|uniref:Translocon-associated protein subunit beta n=1 Tax=Sesamum latifolium TaxID=2727402 RepID=A0AAW2YE55_9LAMI
MCPYGSRRLTVPQFENEDRSFSSIRSKSMAKAFASTIIALLSMVFICSSAFAESGNSPFIVAHKRVSLRKLNSDLERVSVSIDIYNAGSLTAYDVTLTDDSWAEEVFDSVIGNTSKTWERLDSGSLVSHSFELESKVKTVYYGAPALITYRIPTKLKLQRLLAKYGSHVSVVLLIIVFAQVLTTPKSSAAGGNKRKH